MKRILPYLFISLLVFAFFWQLFIKGLLPIPADTIVGLYHPFRDLYAKDYPNGIPFKNFLITDPVRQQYPWRELVVSVEKKIELPLWNPYNFSGTPLLANFQSGSFYPLNFLFFVMPFVKAWSFMIFLGPLLGGVFIFLYLDNLRLNRWASVLGATTFSFSGFFVAWLEWGTITHVGLWLPLILLSIDKLVLSKKNLKWTFIYVFSLASSFFAGHLQIFFYLFIFSWIYFLARLFQFEKKKNIFLLFIILNSLFIILTTVQWVPTLQLILLSARNVDVISFNNPGWFIPWQNLIQFLVPDFFGNPTTLNYWGVWNYGEFVGYIGVAPLILAIFAIFVRYDKKTLFFGTVFFTSLIFSFPNFISRIPFILHIPFLETAQPTRLLFIADFSLTVLAALGFDYVFKNKKKIFIPLIFIGLIFIFLWGLVLLGSLDPVNLPVAKNNLKLPTLIFVLSAAVLITINFIGKGKYLVVIAIAIIIVTFFDLFRFGLKFNPFANPNYLFPTTETISFLQKNIGEFRIMSTDSRILPPNFSTVYRLKSVDGYDPLYLLRYGELIAASERGKPDITPPFGFNRIITPKNYESKIIDLLGVKYILGLKDLSSPKLEKVFQEGETRIYENKDALARAFFVEEVKVADSKNGVIKELFQSNFVLTKTAVVEKPLGVNTNPPSRWAKGKAEIVHYSENKIRIITENSSEGFLVLTDSYYPTWHAAVDGIEAKIYRTDYNFRGVIVPAGRHKIEFYNSLF